MIPFIESGNRIATENFEIGEIYTITFTNGNYKTMCCIGVGSDFVMFQDKLPNALFCLTLGTAETVSSIDIGGGGGSTMNYNELENKPQINGIVLIGNKTSSDLGLLSQADLENYVTDTELTTELADYATNASVVSALASKQDTLTTPQLTAVNSGITSSLVTQIGTNTTAISRKQDRLTTPQLTAVNSGITSSLVTQIGTNTTAIAGKQDTLTTPQLTAVNSGITNSLVNQITTNQNNILTVEKSQGQKNIVNVSDSSGTTWIDINVSLSAGNYALYFGNITTNATGTTCQIATLNSGTIKQYFRIGRGDNVAIPFVLTDNITSIRLYAGEDYAGSNGKNISYTDMMICDKAYYDGGMMDYQPYSMTLTEITAWILSHP